MKYVELIRSLTDANGISGFEDEVVDVIKKYAVSEKSRWTP